MESIFGELDHQGTEVKENMSSEENNKESFGDASFPDSCFAYVPDSAKGENGRKSDRKLPFKNKDGSPDLPHVRNALARLDQTDGISAAEKDSIRGMLQSILKKADPNYKPSKASALTARFCPICGAELDENGACPSKDCSAFGAKIVANGEAKAVNASIEKKVESKNCGTCGQFLDADGKCTNINCVAVATGRKTGALSNETAAENAELLQNKADHIRINADLSDKLADAVKAKIALDADVESLKTEHSNEIAKLKETFEAEKRALESEVSKRDSILAEKTKAIDKALLENKRVYKILNEAGFIVVDIAGNIVSH